MTCLEAYKSMYKYYACLLGRIDKSIMTFRITLKQKWSEMSQKGVEGIGDLPSSIQHPTIQVLGAHP